MRIQFFLHVVAKVLYCWAVFLNGKITTEIVTDNKSAVECGGEIGTVGEGLYSCSH